MKISSIYCGNLYDLPIKNSLSIEKVKSLSQSHIASCALKTLLVSTPLCYLGFSFSTVFPVCLTLIVFSSFISFALNTVKAAINVLVKQGMHYLTLVAQAINDVFQAIYTFISSSSTATIHLLKEKSLFIPNKQVNHATIHSTLSSEEITLPLADFHLATTTASALEEHTDLNSSLAEEMILQVKEDSQTYSQSTTASALEEHNLNSSLAEEVILQVKEDSQTYSQSTTASALEEHNLNSSLAEEVILQVKEDSQTYSAFNSEPQREKSSILAQCERAGLGPKPTSLLYQTPFTLSKLSNPMGFPIQNLQVKLPLEANVFHPKMIHYSNNQSSMPIKNRLSPSNLPSGPKINYMKGMKVLNLVKTLVK